MSVAELADAYPTSIGKELRLVQVRILPLIELSLQQTYQQRNGFGEIHPNESEEATRRSQSTSNNERR